MTKEDMILERLDNLSKRVENLDRPNKVKEASSVDYDAFMDRAKRKIWDETRKSGIFRKYTDDVVDKFVDTYGARTAEMLFFMYEDSVQDLRHLLQNPIEMFEEAIATLVSEKFEV